MVDAPDSAIPTNPASRLHMQIGHAVETVAIGCLNEALARYGGSAIIEDGVTRDMSHYVDPSKLLDVLSEARELALLKGIALPHTVAVSLVVTDSDAVAFVVGR